MAAILSEVGPGDEVILPSYTFVSTANAFALRGATPIFVDISPSDLNIDPARVADAISPNTRVIVPVHYAGVPAEMDTIAELAREHNCLVIEDAAQALGSKYKGAPAGSLGDMAAFSFHETKNIISGEGGALTLTESALIRRAEVIREKGTNRTAFFKGEVDKYTWVDIGSSYLPGELTAAFLYAQVEGLEIVTKNRLRCYHSYREAFNTKEFEDKLELPRHQDHVSHNGHMFYLKMRSAKLRTKFIEKMKEHGVQTPFHYVPLHSSPAGRRLGRAVGPMHVTDRVSEQLVRLPIYNGLGNDVDRVIDLASRTLRTL